MSTVRNTVSEEASRRPVLNHDGGRAQRLHAAAMFALPLAAVVAAIVEWLAGEVRPWEPLLAVGLYVPTILGIAAGFHRMLAHRSFKPVAAVKAALLVLGSSAAQGPALYWAANHRRHHLYADEPLDVHSPSYVGERKAAGALRGFWHAHMGWTFRHRMSNANLFCRDLMRDPLVTWVNRRYWLWVFLGLALPVGIGWLIEGTTCGAWKGLVWGGGVRLFLVSHFVHSVNSITHMYGSRLYATQDHSRNNAWLALPTVGEAWHNNHHACPGSAFFNFRGWQLDVTGGLVRLLEITGLASDVVRPDPRLLSRLQLQKSTKETLDEKPPMP